MTIGEKIRETRLKRGLTQQQVGEKCGMADSAVRIYESDKAMPKLATLQKMAAALDVLVFDLIPPTIGNYIAKAKKRKNISVKQLASMTGIAEEKLIAVLAADHIAISQQEKQALNGALGIDLDTFRLLGVETFEGEPVQHLIPHQDEIENAMRQMNKNGQDVAIHMLQALAQIPDYQRKPQDETKDLINHG